MRFDRRGCLRMLAGGLAARAVGAGRPSRDGRKMASPEECLGLAPDATARDLTGLTDFLRGLIPGNRRGEAVLP
jgi:hypothetical protein